MAKLSKTIFFTVSAIAVGAYLSLPAWRGSSEQKRNLAIAQQKLRDSQDAKVAIIEEKTALESSSGREEMARSKGLIRPGERALVIE